MNMDGETGPLLTPPPEGGPRQPAYGPDWHERIERAKRARELGKQIHEDARKRQNSHKRIRKHDFAAQNSPVRGRAFRPL